MASPWSRMSSIVSWPGPEPGSHQVDPGVACPEQVAGPRSPLGSWRCSAANAIVVGSARSSLDRRLLAVPCSSGQPLLQSRRPMLSAGPAPRPCRPGPLSVSEQRQHALLDDVPGGPGRQVGAGARAVGGLVDGAAGAAHAVEDADQAEVPAVAQDRVGILALPGDLGQVETEATRGGPGKRPRRFPGAGCDGSASPSGSPRPSRRDCPVCRRTCVHGCRTGRRVDGCAGSRSTGRPRGTAVTNDASGVRTSSAGRRSAGEKPSLTPSCRWSR